MIVKIKSIAHHSAIVILLALFSIAFSSCNKDRYQLEKDKEGRTIRLNKRTGEIAILSDDRLIIAKAPEKPPKSISLDTFNKIILGEVKNWPALEYKTIESKAELKTSWLGESLRYRLILRPEPKNFKQNVFNPSIVINFYDANGFIVIKVDINKSDFNNVVDDKGEIIGVQVNSEIPCSGNKFAAINTWDLSWR